MCNTLKKRCVNRGQQNSSFQLICNYFRKYVTHPSLPIKQHTTCGFLRLEFQNVFFVSLRISKACNKNYTSFLGAFMETCNRVKQCKLLI